MILAVAATEFEIDPFRENITAGQCQNLICGVGPVESCLRLTRYLEQKSSDLSLVVNFGVAGAYCSEDQADGPQLLDICLAEAEYLGDLGICFPRRLDDLPGELVTKEYILDSGIRKRAEQELQQSNIKYHSGPFVTVSSASGTRERGTLLQRKHRAICENMEGAAIARVCNEYNLPLLQLRCISNMVDNRDPERWKLSEAAEICGKTAAFLIERLG